LSQNTLQINDDVCRGLLQHVELRELGVGEPLFYQGDNPDAYWIILSGALSLFMFQDKTEARNTSKRFRQLTTYTLKLTKELLCPGVLGDPVATLRSGVGLGELSLLGIGNVHRACAAVAAEPTTMLMVEPVMYREFLREEHLKLMNIRDKIEVLTSIFAFTHWQSCDVTNLAVCMHDSMVCTLGPR